MATSTPAVHAADETIRLLLTNQTSLIRIHEHSIGKSGGEDIAALIAALREKLIAMYTATPT